MTLLEVRGLRAAYGPHAVLHGLTLAFETGRIHGVLGPSGCGKSTLLRCMAGLKDPDAGRVFLDGVDVTHWRPERRRVVLLHQENTLFPHLDVRQNVLFGPRARGQRGDLRRRADELLDVVRLGGFGSRRVTDLSGGERQRVALARALAAEPRVLLLDEPLSHLDQPLRLALRADIRRILRAAGTTAVHVTHDREEAFATADRLVLLDAGRVVDDGDPARLHDRPGSPRAARLLGHRNVLPVFRDSRGARSAIGPVEDAEAAAALYREDALRVEPAARGPAVQVVGWEYVGGAYRVAVDLDGVRLWALQPTVDGLTPGGPARLSASPVRPVTWSAPEGSQADTI